MPEFNRCNFEAALEYSMSRDLTDLMVEDIRRQLRPEQPLFRFYVGIQYV